MKKYIYSFITLLTAVFAFSSCEDVPAPYSWPEAGGSSSSTIEAKGNGTLDDPFNVEGVIAYINAGENLDQKVYFKGYVTSIKECSASYGNATFYIASEKEGTNTFYVYRCLGLGGKNIESDDQIKEGDEVVVYGKVTDYNGTKETVQKEAYIYSINGEGGTGGGSTSGEAKGTGTQADPYNPVAANNFINSLEDNATSENDVYIKGKISKVKECSAQFGNATFYITENGTTDETDFYVYRCLGLENKAIDSDSYVKVGDEVIICGKVTKYVSSYGTTPETVQKQAYIYSLNGKTEGGSTDPGTDPNPGTDPTDPAAGLNMSSADISAALPDLTTNAYGSQAVATESTWMTWTYENVSWKGCRICNATDSNLGIQLQGNASDAAKQGFIFNATAFTSISKIIITASTTSSSTYEPSFNLYVGTEAHPTSTNVTPTKSVEAGDYKVYTYTYDVASENCTFFTIWNNLVGALYINNIQVITK